MLCPFGRLVTRIALTIRFTTFRIVQRVGPLARLPLGK